MRRRAFVGLGLVGLGATGCTREPVERTPVERPTRTTTPTPTPSPTPAPPTPTPTRTPTFDATSASRHVERLAGRIGPREATSAAYGRAADYVEHKFRLAGLEVRRQRLTVPAGESWGVPVPEGRTVNLIATLPGTDLTEPHLVVGAHLDTVPQAPGAEDNASGIAVLLELARMVGLVDPPETHVCFVAFGAEEPRGPTDDDHHYGSRHYVERLNRVERRAVVGMVSLDRVGTGPDVRIRTAREQPTTVSIELLRAARRVDVPTSRGVNRSSDHWSFVRAGMPAARIGGHAYAGYHNPDDQPDVVRRKQLDRTGNLLWEWITLHR